MVGVHLHIKPIDSLEAIFVLLLQVFDLKEEFLLFFSVDLGVKPFVAERVQVSCLKSFSLFNRVKRRDSIASGKDIVLSSIIVCISFNNLGLVDASNLDSILLLATTIITGHAKEAWMSPAAESLGHHLFKVYADK